MTGCLQLHGGLPDTTGVRSKAFSYGVDLDPNVVALVVVSGTNPHPGITTSMLTRGRKPFMTKRFANLRIDAYVFHRNGVMPVPHAMASAARMVTKTVNLCVAVSH